MTVDIQQQLDDIAAMEDAFVQPSCNPAQPMVLYPDTGTPPMLSFNIPQTTTFTTYGKLVKYIDPTWFKPFTLNVPTYNFFSYVKTLTPQAVTQLFHANVATPAILGQFVPVTGGAMPAATPAPAGGYGRAIAPSGSLVTRLASSSLRVAAMPLSSAIANRVSAISPQLVQAVPNTAPASPIANFAQQGIRGLYTHRIMNGGATVKYVAQPPVPVPRIMVVEEYTTGSYLGNYGAGKVVKTFTLLPGERTTISIRTYEDQDSTSSAADNVLDSFSDSSATELDNMMQQEQGVADSSSATSGGNDSSYNTYSDAQNSSSAWNVSAKVGLGDFLSIGGGYGRSTSDTSTTAGGFADQTQYSNAAVRSSNINTLNNALNKHVQQSNANRQVQVNHTTTNSVSSGEDDTTVREIQNVNLNRVLNFTYRQLLQEYTTLTWLSGLKFAYTNGYPESYKIVDLANLPHMLADIIKPGSPTVGAPTYVDQVMCLLLKPYCNVLDYDGNVHPFINAISLPVGGCLADWLPTCMPDPDELIWRKDPTAQMTYNVDGVDVTVDGIILSVQKQTLQTSSIIGDALLGAGDALDCFNQKAQDATTMAAYISNLRAMQQLEQSIQDQSNDQDIATQKLAAITAITDPVSAATLYKKVYGDCCDVPQNTDNGCGC